MILATEKEVKFYLRMNTFCLERHRTSAANSVPGIVDGGDEDWSMSSVGMALRDAHWSQLFVISVMTASALSA